MSDYLDDAQRAVELDQQRRAAMTDTPNPAAPAPERPEDVEVKLMCPTYNGKRIPGHTWTFGAKAGDPCYCGEAQWPEAK